MPGTLGVRSLQDVCLHCFCLHLSELSITSDLVLPRLSNRQQVEEVEEKAAHGVDPETVQNPSLGAENGIEQISENNVEQHASNVGPATECGAGQKKIQETEHVTVHAEQEACQETRQNSEQKAEQEADKDPAQTARTYLLLNVPPCFFEQLVHDTLTIINKHFYNPRYKFRRPAMVAVAGWLLGDHVRHLSLDQCRMLCDRLAVPHVFRCLRNMPRLQTLTIGRLNFWKIPELDSLADLLSGLRQLTTLHLEYICLPEMVAGLADKCPQLQELSLKDSEKVTDREVPEIMRCQRLRSLNISGTSVTGAGSWDILRALPALTWFEHCPFNCNSGPFLFDSREAMLSYIWDFLSPEGHAHSAELPSVTRQMALPSQNTAPAPAPAPASASAPAPASARSVSEEPVPGVPAAEGAGQVAEASSEAASGEAAEGAAGAGGVATSVRSEVAAGHGAETQAESSERSSEAVTAGQQSSQDAESGGAGGATDEGGARGPPADGGVTNDSAGVAHGSSGEAERAALNVEATPSRESSVGADRSSASSDRRVSPLVLSRSSSGCPTPRPLRIENFWLFNPKTEEVALARLCPAVRLLRLDFVFQDMGRSPELVGLVHLQHVTRLEINSFDAPRFSVLSEVLRQLGGQLTELALHVCDDYTASAALENAVARWCPRLERYAFTGDYSVRVPAERGDDDLDFAGLRRRHLALSELSLGGFVTGRRLLFLLAHATALRRLRLDGELRYLWDDGFRQLLAANPLRQLEELWVNVSTGLTLQAVLPLLYDPDCRLRRLGRLSSLQRMDRAQFIELRDQVRAQNLAVDLVWVTPGV